MGESIAIITARGGSKRIPKKNIREFLGKPIIAYSIEAAIKSELFSEVMVSTDSEEIAEIARKYGAMVPFMRSAKTSNDYAITADVIREVLGKYKERGRIFEYVCCIYPTAPFVTADKLKQAMDMMKKNKPEVIIPVVAFSFPPQRGYLMGENGLLSYIHPEYLATRSQDLELQYHDAGQFYLYQTDSFMACNGRFTDGIMPLIVSNLEVQDIDNENDWKIAEMKYQLMQESFR